MPPCAALRTLLVEKEDFAYGTTSRSTRLIHGGLRYLRMFDFKLVHQDLHEREILLKIAPHLVHRLEFVIPLLKKRAFLPVDTALRPVALQHFPTARACRPAIAFLQQETMKLEPSLA